ncbi:MAG: HYR domain-containing protein, partial [Vicinamibacterales bacterium]
GSSDPDGDPLTYQWQCTDGDGNKCLLILLNVVNVTDVRAQFRAGTWHLTLTVTDPSGASSSDSAQVKVLVDNAPPTVTPPDDETVSATDDDGARGAASSKLHDFLFNTATAADNSTTIFTHLPPQVAGADVDDATLFPHGTTTVTFRIADSYGNVGTATADVLITDMQSGDLVVGVQRAVTGGPTKGVVQRIRNGSVTDFCESPDPVFAPLQPGDPVFWNRPDQIVVDSKGRVTFVAALSFGGPFSPSAQNGWGLLRCSHRGQPAEQLGIFPERSVVDPGWPEPLPGKFFYPPGLLPGQPIAGLHLRKVKHLEIVNNANPQIVTDESVVFGYHESSIPDNTAGVLGNLTLNTKSLTWTANDLLPLAVGFTTTGPQNMLPEMFFHSKIEIVSVLGLPFPAPVAATYLARAGVMRRIYEPLRVELTSDTPLGTVTLGVAAFAGSSQMPNSPLMDDLNYPNVFPGCAQEGRGWPIFGNGGYTSLQTDGVIFEKTSGLVVNSFSWFGNLSEALFDLNPDNDREAYFKRPETGCTESPIVDFTPLAGNGVLGYNFDSLGRGLWPDRMTASPNGVFGTIGTSGRVVQATGATDLSDVATGLLAPRGLGAFPPQLGHVQVSALIVRIDSPVDVVLTDALGRRVGVLDGQDINEFGSQAHDTGAQTHPRLYIIREPQAGNYSLRSIGTASGPFTVHVYSVDSEKKVTEHISHTGAAQPGSTATHDFDLSAIAHITFANSVPVADAGADQIADADSSGHASFALDASLSSDSDGDALTYTWAGPFGILSGAQVNATLGVGLHVLTLTVDDGHGGSAQDTVHLSVNAVAPPTDTTPPVLTLPANIVVQAASSAGAVVHFTATANDNVDGSVPVMCEPAPGTTFTVGTTTVNCRASDLSDNSASGSFSVTVTPAPTAPCAKVSFELLPGSAAVTKVRVTLIDRRSGAALDTFDARIGIPRSVPAGKYRLLFTAPAGYEVTPVHRSLKLKCGDDVRVKLRFRPVPPRKREREREHDADRK